MSFTGLVAYIDPASGTILLQLIVAGALGSMAFFRKSIAKCFSLWIRKPSEGQPTAAGDVPTEAATPAQTQHPHKAAA